MASLRRGAGHGPAAFIASLLSLALFCAPACAFLYARSEMLSPPALNFASLAVVNASAYQTVILTEAFDSTLYLTLTSSFPSYDRLDYTIVTRPILLRCAELATDDIFVDFSSRLAPPGGVVWALFNRPLGQCTARAISLLNASVVSEIDISLGGDHREWRMEERGDGSLIPVVANDSNVCWPRTNGSLACIEAPFSVWGMVPGTDLFLALAIVDSNVTVWRADLSNDAPAAYASLALPGLDNSLMHTRCVIPVNGSLAFLTSVNKTLALLLIPDPQTLTLTVVPLRAYLSGQTDLMQCGPTIVSTQYLAWAPQYDASVRLFLLDVAVALLTPLTLDSTFLNVVNVAVSKGDVSLASCDSLFTPTSCQLQWFLAFNASAAPDSMLDMPFSSQIAGYDTANQPLPDVAVISTITADTPGFVVLRLAGEAVDVLAWISVGVASGIRTLAVDPHSLAILFTPRSLSFYVIDWAAPPTLSAFTALLKDPLPAYYEARVVLASSYRYPQTFYASAQLADRQTEKFTLFIVSLSPTITLEAISNLTDIVSHITEGPTGATLFVTSSAGVYQVSLTNSSVLNMWPYPPDVFMVKVLATLLQPDLSRLYIFLYDSFQSNASCAAIDLTEPARPMRVTVIPFSESGESAVLASGHAVLARGFLYFGFTAAAGQIAKFDQDCTFLELFTTTLPPCGSSCRQNPVISAPDAIIFAHSPNLYPIYLDCGLGSYRNLSSGACGPCPQGSVSSVADTQACVPCPARTAPDAHRVSCLCSAGYYNATDSSNCGTCPVGGVCGGNNTLAAAPGFWRANDSLTEFYACPYAAGCNGSDACAAGYEGVLCAVCARGFTLRISRCVECADLASTIVFWSVALVVYSALFILVLYAGPSSVSVLKSFISFAQIVTFPTSGPMPRLLAARFAPILSKFFSLANLQLLSIVSPDCLLRRHVAYPVEALATALLPIATLLVIGSILALPWKRLARLLRCNHSPARPALAVSDPFNEAAPDLAAQLETYKQSGAPLRAMLFVVLVATPSVTRELASFFTCQSVSGASYLLRDFAVRCDSSLWRTFAAPVSILLAFYGLGVPLGLWLLLVRCRHRLDISFLHNAYRNEFYWWELTEQGRKLCLLLLNAVLAPRHPAHYAPVSLAVSVVALAAHLQARPYKTALDAAFQTADLAAVIMFFLWAVTPPEDSGADLVAWLYWIFAVLYTLASLAALMSVPAQRLVLWLRSRIRRTQHAEPDAESELNALLMKPRGD